jgi:hypothetical protein
MIWDGASDYSRQGFFILDQVIRNFTITSSLVLFSLPRGVVSPLLVRHGARIDNVEALL